MRFTRNPDRSFAPGASPVHRRPALILACLLAGAAWAGAAPQAPVTNSVQPANDAASSAEPRNQLAGDSARLLKLAAELKAEVDKTNKDVLSVTVIRKADEIEKLTRAMKEKPTSPRGKTNP
jgi:hypothetical protein